MSGTTAAKKRKYFDRGGGGKSNKRKWSMLTRPKRGSPGVLLTCETGREQKCQREGLEILNHYYSTSVGDAAGAGNPEDGKKGDEETTKPLSLEEELSLLKSKKGSSESSAFGVYDTNCRGTIFVLCTLPKCNLIPAIQTEYMRSKMNNKTEPSKSEPAEGDSDKSPDQNESGLDAKNSPPEKAEEVSGRNNAEDVKKSLSELQNPPPWDPITTVKAIMSDIDNDSNKEAPSSRFVTRMIPIQATCFASSEELQLTCDEVLKRFISKNTKTFAIVFKRRNCSSLDRNKAIKIVGDAMLKLYPDCKVNLGAPDATIIVEVCGTLCGIVVVEKFKAYRNFNLMGATPTLDKN